MTLPVLESSTLPLLSIMRVLGVPATVRLVVVVLLPERVLRVLLLVLLPEIAERVEVDERLARPVVPALLLLAELLLYTPLLRPDLLFVKLL